MHMIKLESTHHNKTTTQYLNPRHITQIKVEIVDNEEPWACVSVLLVGQTRESVVASWDRQSLGLPATTPQAEVLAAVTQQARAREAELLEQIAGAG